MIAGVLTVEQREALDRLRSRAAVRVHQCQDEPAPERGKHGRFVSAPPRVTAAWVPANPSVANRPPRLLGDGGGQTGKIRRALRLAPAGGMTSGEIRALADTGNETVRLLGEMRDVEVNRAAGYGWHRYRLKR